MKVIQMLRFEREDMALPRYHETVYNLLGIRFLPDDIDERGRPIPHPWHKPFMALRGNQATLEDIAAITRVVKERADELRHEAETVKPFCDERTNALYADGLRSTAMLAEREWATFLSHLEDDLAQAA